MNWNHRLKKIIIITASAALVLLMTSCPQQLTAPLVALVEDKIPPTLNINTPRGGDNYYSTVTVTGTISDDVLLDGDESGQIKSVFYEIANDDFRKGKITIGLDDTVMVDESFGNGTIEYDIFTGDFEFSFSTLQSSAQPKLRDVISLSITAVDRNDNEIIEQLNLMESNGPYVDFTFYDSDYNEGSKTTTLPENQDIAYFGGYVGNSDYQIDVADEIAELSWTVAGSGLGAVLDITEGSADWNSTNGVFQTTNNFEDAVYFRYDPDEKFFYSETFIDVSDGSQTFIVTAVDAYGHSSTSTQILSEPASLMMSSLSSTKTHYANNPDPEAPSSTTIQFSSKITDPNDGFLTSDQIESVKCTFSSTLGSATEPINYTKTIYDGSNFDTVFHMSTDPGRITVDIDTTNWSADDLVGDVYAYITVKEPDENPKSRSILVQRDDDPPTIPIVNFTGGSGDFVKGGDSLTLNFTTEDGTGAGVSSIHSILVNGDIATATPSGNDWTVTYPVPTILGADSEAAGDPLGYAITLFDDAGNKAEVTVNDAKTLYGPYFEGNSHNLVSDECKAYTNTGNESWARAANSPALDTVTVTFTSPRVLSGNPVVYIAGREASVSYSSVDEQYTATLILNGSDETTADETEIQVLITSTDIVGNQETWPSYTGVYYDKTKPGQPPAPIWGGAYSPFMNNTDLTPATVSFSGVRSTIGADIGDSIELYLDNTSGSSIGSADYADNSTAETTVTFSKASIDSVGPKTLYSRIIDPAGNISDYSSVCDVIVDKSVDSIEAGISYSGTTSKDSTIEHYLTGSTSASDINKILSYRWLFTGPTTFNYGPYPVNSPATDADLSVLAADLTGGDGEYTAELEITDAAGNVDSDTFTFIWDTTAPTVTGLPDSAAVVGVNDNDSYTAIVSDGTDSSGINASSYIWNIVGIGGNLNAYNNYDDGLDDAEIKLNIKNDDAAYSGPWIADGKYRATLSVSDNIGYSGSGYFDFFKDLTAPIISGVSHTGTYDIVSFPETASVDDGYGIGVDELVIPTLTKVSGPGTVSSDISYAAIDEWKGTITASNISCDADGEYTVTFGIEDESGNPSISDANSQFSFFWDANGPTAPITGGSAVTKTAMNLTAAPFDGANGSGVDETNYSWSFDTGVTSDGSTNTLTVNNVRVTGSDGPYTATFHVSDEAGNPTASKFDFYWDTTGPVITHEDNAVKGILNSGFTHNITLSDVGTTVDTGTINWAIDGPGASSDYSSYSNEADVPIVISDLSSSGSNDGNYTATITVKDDLENESTSNITFTIDTIGPVIDFGGVTDLGWVNEVSFTASATENPSSVDWSSDVWSFSHASTSVSDISSNTFSFTDADLDYNGEYTATYTIDDTLGNSSTKALTFNWDDDKPDIGSMGITSYIEADSKSAAWTKSDVSGVQDHSTIGNHDSGLASTSWSFLPDKVNFTAGGTLAAPTVTISSCDENGQYEGTLTVYDNAGNSETGTFIFIWDTEAPSGTAVTDLTGINTPDPSNGAAVTPTVTDSGSGIASYSWTITQPTGATATNTTGITTATLHIKDGDSNDINLHSTNGTDDGVYTVQFTAKDYLDNEYTDEFQFHWDSLAPTWTDITNLAGYQTTAFTIAPAISDPVSNNTAAEAGSGIKSYSWHVTGGLQGMDTTLTQSSLSINQGINNLPLSTTGTNDGAYNVTLTVTDYAGNSANDSFTFSWDGNSDGDLTKSILSSPENPNFIGGTPVEYRTYIKNSARISTYNFETEISDSDSGQLANTVQTVSYQPYSRRTISGGYNGSLYTLPSAESTPAELSQISKHADELTTAELTPETEIAMLNPVAPQTAAAKAAAASLTGQTAVISADTSTSPEKQGVSPALLFIPITGAGYLIYRRKKR